MKASLPITHYKLNIHKFFSMKSQFTKHQSMDPGEKIITPPYLKKSHIFLFPNGQKTAIGMSFRRIAPQP